MGSISSNIVSVRLSLLLAILFSSCSLIFQLGHGAPIKIPDLTKCHPATDKSVVGPPTSLTFHCCLPVPNKDIVDFSFDKYPAVKRIRRPAQRASKEYVKKLEKAYKLMKALPTDDPRSFAKQADVHCAFCNGAYKQLGNNITLQVHFSWLFLPWHRWYLYFHERILGSLIGDEDFALSFWNWDDQEDGGNVMPPMFVKNGSSIYDEKRNQNHLPPTLVRLNVLSTTTNDSVVIQENLNHMYQSIVTASTTELFMGGAYRVGIDDSNSSVLSAPLGGSLENDVHNAIHFWTGNPALSLFQNMGTFSTAARDPIFFAHHSNVDRLWNVWKSIPGGRRVDYTDPDFLDAEFLFYDENANPVRVKVRDALDSSKLGVHYKSVKSDKLWKNFAPQSVTNGTTSTTSSDVKEIGSEDESSKESIELGKKLSAWVKRPSKPSAEFVKSKGVKTATELEEVLVIQGLELPSDTFVQLVFFVNMPDADDMTKTSGAEYVGTFNSIQRLGDSTHKKNLKFEIGDNLKRIGIDNTEKVLVTIVVETRGKDVDATIKGMKIEWQ